MWIALLALLVQELAPPLAKLVVTSIEALTASIKTMNAPPSTAGVAQEIVLGIARDHPDWSGVEKFDAAFQAIRMYLVNHGVSDPPTRTINLLIETTVTAVLSSGVPKEVIPA